MFLEITLSLTLTFGVGYQVDVYPVLGVPYDIPISGMSALSLPHLVLLDEWSSRYTSPRHSVRAVWEHELEHQRQWQALGPAFPFLYALARGRGFEDYHLGYDMWLPPPEMRRCPMFRFEAAQGSAAFRFMPCWEF